MDAAQRERYRRHIQLEPIGESGQRKLLDARVFIVGAGGLGSPAAMYLASAGVGHLVIADFDRVELSNLQRQLLHRTADIGEDKVSSAKRTLAELNPEVRVTALAFAPDDEELEQQVAAADVVVDACDNFETRFALNRACVRHRIPLVSGAAVRCEGQVSVFDARDPGAPCYRCLYDDSPGEGEACGRVGVLAPLLGAIGSVQAIETMKLILAVGDSLSGRVLMLDALAMEWRSFRLRKDPRCPVCAAPEAARLDRASA